MAGWNYIYSRPLLTGTLKVCQRNKKHIEMQTSRPWLGISKQRELAMQQNDLDQETWDFDQEVKQYLLSELNCTHCPGAIICKQAGWLACRRNGKGEREREKGESRSPRRCGAWKTREEETVRLWGGAMATYLYVWEEPVSLTGWRWAPPTSERVRAVTSNWRMEFQLSLTYSRDRSCRSFLQPPARSWRHLIHFRLTLQSIPISFC